MRPQSSRHSHSMWVQVTDKFLRQMRCVHLDAENEQERLAWIERPSKAPKFSWVIPELLAAHGRPTKPGHIKYLCQNGITRLVTLTENKPTVLHRYPGTNLTWFHIPVKDEQAPKTEQVEEFVKLVKTARKEKQKISVHCAWGRGRTGTMCACYLMQHADLGATQAIADIRRLRPGSIDTPEQEAVVKKYHLKSAEKKTLQ